MFNVLDDSALSGLHFVLPAFILTEGPSGAPTPYEVVVAVGLSVAHNPHHSPADSAESTEFFSSRA